MAGKIQNSPLAQHASEPRYTMNVLDESNEFLYWGT